jgi:anti-sigma regulatory factor (Ser/Thr protein kinase)
MYGYNQESHSQSLAWDINLVQNLRRVVIHQEPELRPLAEKIEIWMRVLGYPRKDIFAVLLALRESVRNAVRHGNQGDPSREVRISYLVTPDYVVMEVEDEGRGFDPRTVANPMTQSGPGRAKRKRGLFLMQVYMNCVAITPPGNRVSFGRKRSSS